MKKYIHASKIYKNSRFKSQIDAALDNPINVELVQQLKSYLDEPELAEDTKPAEEVEPELDKENEPTPSNKPNLGGGSRPSMSAPRPGGSGHLADDFDKAEDLGLDNEAPDIEEPEKDEEEPVASATKITSCKELFEAINVDILKGTLNNVQDTAGVRRVSIMPDTHELWVYYNDNVNLNDVMEAVIDSVVSSYSQLSFNRLARTDNAVVFTPSITTVDTEVKEDE